MRTHTHSRAGGEYIISVGAKRIVSSPLIQALRIWQAPLGDLGSYLFILNPGRGPWCPPMSCENQAQTLHQTPQVSRCLCTLTVPSFLLPDLWVKPRCFMYPNPPRTSKLCCLCLEWKPDTNVDELLLKQARTGNSALPLYRQCDLGQGT